MKLSFKEWLKEEMTSASAVGGCTSTADIAKFARPLFSEPIRRIHKKKNKKD